MENIWVTEKKIADKASEFVDKKYALSNKVEGWDCINTLIEFYTSLGVDFPRSFEGYDEMNYGEKWSKDMVKASKVFGKFLLTLGKKVENGRPKRGDLLIFKAKELHFFPGIYLGNGQVMVVFGDSKKPGPKNIPIKFVSSFLVEIRRLID